MNRVIVGAAFAVALLGSASAFAAEAPAAGGTTPTPATTTDTPPTPPASLKCKAPKVPTQVTVKGKTTWKCKVPPAAPAPQ